MPANPRHVLNLVEGWTEPIAYVLKADGVVVDLTGKTVTLSAISKYTPKTFLGSVSILSEADGTVSFTPDASDLLASESPYYIRFRVEPDGYFLPNDDPETWIVRK